MRTRRELYPEKPIVYTCEMDTCPCCGAGLAVAYVSGVKTVQTMTDVLTIAQRTKRCVDSDCASHSHIWPSVRWQQVAPLHCTYGYDVIARIGWERQVGRVSFEGLHASLASRLVISEAEVRYLYHTQYLPLLACHERQDWGRLQTVAEQRGLILSLDGLAPEGGEPQLWVVREMWTGLTLRSGWLSQQDQAAFVNLLRPIREAGLRVEAILSDKQRGLVPAVAEVFPHAKHSFCQTHYFKNATTPVAEADEAMKVALRKQVRQQVGTLLRQEKEERPGVLTVTGLLPSPVEEQPPPPQPGAGSPPPPASIVQEREAIVQDLLRRVRYLLTLKGRPPFRLAGLDMVERLTEVETCVARLLQHQPDPRLLQLQQGLHHSLQAIQSDYTDLRQAADWLTHLADLLDPDGKPARSSGQVRQELFTYLDNLQPQIQDAPRLLNWYQTLYQTSLHYAPGLFHCYDVPGLPRTNNDRESEFRDLNRRLLATTGQKGLTRRLIQREGAWELIPHPTSLQDTIIALSQVDPHDLQQEQQRVRTHRSRFRLHTRSARQSQAQLKHLEQRWSALPPASGP